MLGKISCWNDNLSTRNAIVFQEDNLEKVMDWPVVINYLTNCINQLDETLGILVTWGCLTSNKDNSWDKFLISLLFWSPQDIMISMDNIKDVHKLTFVFMDSLDHNIVHSINANINTLSLLYVMLQLFLAFILDCQEFSDESLISRTSNDLFDHPHIRDPVIIVADGLWNKLGEARITAVEPSSRGNTISHIKELVWE